LERWTNWSQEDGNCQLLEQSQKAFMNKSVIVSEETHKLLKEYCQSEGIKTQHLADRIIREWLEKKKEAKP
jgi:2-oxoglutarate dehydrogenase complex dehydrogenase (E1) component-like enzyme